ncbi:MAG: glutathione S-transferase N-terminal domain-containing protein [Gammaproteobacteria bacterium]
MHPEMFDDWFNPRPVEIPAVTRDAAQQAAVDAATASLALYHYDSCGFCRRVRQAIAALGLDIELRNVMEDRERHRELLTHGGRSTVPCLCIGKNDPATAQWMYESADIIAWLVERFGATG